MKPREISRRRRRSLLVAIGCTLLSLALGEAAHAQSLTMTWTDNTGGTASTVIERRRADDAAFGPIASVAPGATAYVDVTVTSGATYCYRVIAFVGDQVSDYSNEACATAASPGGFTLAVVKAGAGAGGVTSGPSGIACGSICSAQYPQGTWVTLTASPEPGYRFVGWSGACGGASPSCAVTGTGTAVVVAEFAPQDENLVERPPEGFNPRAPSRPGS